MTSDKTINLFYLSSIDKKVGMNIGICIINTNITV